PHRAHRPALAPDAAHALPGPPVSLARCFSIMPPATPTPSTYIHPSWKSKMCELKSEVKIFCTTTSSPIHATKLSPLNSNRCDIHIAHNTTTPGMPHCTATLKVWLCGLPMTYSEACRSGEPTAARSNSPRVEPVP